MSDQLGLVKNPLSVIAIFAGLAEVSATVALPQLPAPVQTVFVWFVMLFPVLLVVLFFLVLWVKPQVFYAPSDYRDESNFMKHFVPGASAAPVAATRGAQTEGVAGLGALRHPEAGASARAEALLAQDLVLGRLASTLGLRFLRDVQLRGRQDLRFDGVAQGAAGAVLAETALLPGLAAARDFIRDALGRAAQLEGRIPPRELRGARLILAPVLRDGLTDAEQRELEGFLRNRLAEVGLPFAAELTLFSWDELKKGWGA